MGLRQCRRFIEGGIFNVEGHTRKLRNYDFFRFTLTP